MHCILIRWLREYAKTPENESGLLPTGVLCGETTTRLCQPKRNLPTFIPNWSARIGLIFGIRWDYPTPLPKRLAA